jgi:hypothetical protein
MAIARPDEFDQEITTAEPWRAERGGVGRPPTVAGNIQPVSCVEAGSLDGNEKRPAFSLGHG